MIHQIKLENFKCHNLFQENIKELTILTGSNATGKSSIIQSILLAVKSYQNLEQKRVKTNDIFDINLGLPDRIISENFDEEKMKIGLCMQEDVTQIDTVVLGLDDVDDASFRICNYDEMLEDMEMSKSIMNYCIYYLNAERIGPRITYGMKDLTDEYVGSHGEYTGYVIDEMDKKQRLNTAMVLPELLRASPISRFSANCEGWLQTIIPGTSLKCSVDKEKNISVIKFQNEGDDYLPTATGFGISYVLPIIVQGLVASMKEDAILLVENPEAHLHPYSQTAIGKYLAFIASSGVQVIVETHSEHVIDGCRIQLAHLNQCGLMKTIFFTRNGQESVHKNIGTKGNGELEEWPEGFFDQKRLDLRELLEMRRCEK